MASRHFGKLFKLVGLGRDITADVDAEIGFHLEAQIADLIRQGHPAEDARREALRRFGDREAARSRLVALDSQSHVRRRRLGWVQDFAKDAGYAFRGIRRAPGFAVGVAVTLGLGIGANAAIFRLVDAMLLRPIPGVENPEQLLEVGRVVSYPLYQRLASEATADLTAAGYRVRTFAVGTESASRPERVALVSGNYFATLGTRTILGRTLGAGDDVPGAPPAVVVSYAYWKQSLGERPGVVGETIRVNGASATVIGVAPKGFRGLRVFENPVAWIAINTWPLIAPSSLASLEISRPTWGWLTTFVRLKPGVTQARAQQAVTLVSTREYEARGFRATERDRLIVSPAVGEAVGESGRMLPRLLSLLLGAVGLVLLLACANVATLLLARAQARQRENAVRIALGGGRGRLVRQLLTEALALGLLGGVTGLLAYYPAIRALGRVTLPGGMVFDSVGLDANDWTLAVAILLGIGSALLVGVLPALRGSRPNAVATLFSAALRGGAARSRLRGALVAVQAGLAMILLVGALLFGRSLRRALVIDPGFDPHGIGLVTVDLGLARYQKDRAAAYYQQALEQVRALPGVESAALTVGPPLIGDEWIESFLIVGEPPPEDGKQLETGWVGVGADYWSTLRAPLAKGRPMSAGEVTSGAKVVVVNETLAKKYWPNGDPIGRRLVVSGDTLTVIGVARDLRAYGLEAPVIPMVYTSSTGNTTEAALTETTIMVRGRGGVVPSTVGIASAIRNVDPSVPVKELGSYDEAIAKLLVPQRLAFSLLGAFGILALVVAAVGVYSVVARVVAAQQRELGIRAALGASSGRIVGLVVGQQARPVLIGIGLGVLGGVGLSRFATGFLYGLTPTDPPSIVGAGLLLGLVALAAALVPAVRGVRASPLVSLRSE